MAKKIISVVGLMFLLYGCTMPEWIGGSTDKDKIEGERISVLKFDAEISPSNELKDIAVSVPPERDNDAWYKSSGYHRLTPENMTAPEQFDNVKYVKIGKGSKDKQHLSSSPVVAEGKVFTIDSSGIVSAFDAFNVSTRKWRYKIDIPEDKGNFYNAGISYDSGKIYIATGYNIVIALNAEDGSLIWRRTINSIGRSAPAVGSGIVLVSTIDNSLYAMDAADGAILWIHAGVVEEISVLGSASPVIYNDLAFVPYSSGELYALRLLDGSEVWSENFTLDGSQASYGLSDIDSSPIIAGNKVYIVSNDGMLAATDIHSGTRIWEKEVNGSRQPWYADNFLYMLSDSNQLVCIQASSGGIKWVQQLPSYEKEKKKSGPISWSGPVMAGSRLLLVSSNGRMLSIDPKNGDILAKNRVVRNIYTSPVVANKTLYLLSDEAKLFALSGSFPKAGRTEEKESKWFWKKEESKKVEQIAKPEKKPEVEKEPEAEKAGGVFDRIKGIFGGKKE